jgi:3-oxoacyl-[acyl-carrier-protein] synthase-1
MDPLPILGCTAVSALGTTPDQLRASLRAGRTGLATGSQVLPGAACPVGEVRDPLPPLPESLAAYDSRCTRLLALALAPLAPVLDGLRARIPAPRLGVVVGTSASGNRDLEDAYRADGAAGYDYHRRQVFGAVAVVAARLVDARGPAWTVSTACSSGANAVISAARLLRTGTCDAVVVASVDALCWTTYHGFRGLGVMDARTCRPFDVDRQGLNLGEGAAAMVLVRDRPQGPADGPDLFLAGWGAGSEAYHMTAPEPEGEGAARVMAEALGRAGIGPSDVGYVNLHGTATPANDSAESRGMVKVLGTDVPCSSTKGFTGHLLGAAAGVEAAITLMALADERLPCNLGCQTLDPDVQARILRQDLAAPGIRYALSNSFAFGGNDTSLVFGVRR